MAIPKLESYALPAVSELPVNKVKWTVEPQRAALLIHDMQKYFLNFWRPFRNFSKRWSKCICK